MALAVSGLFLKPFHEVKKAEGFKTFPWLSVGLSLPAAVGTVVAHVG